MKHIIIVSLWVYCGFAFSASAELPLQCKETENSKNGVLLSAGNHNFYLRHAERGCNGDYIYKGNFTVSTGGVIISLPASDDLGLNAQNIVYSTSRDSDEIVFIGQLPASATEVKEGLYINIVQAGGTIYETLYKVDSGKTITISPGKELIMSDTECIYEHNFDSVCKSMSGDLEQPLCVLNDNGRKLLINIDACSGFIN